MRPLFFSSACLAPLTITAFACSGGTDVVDPPVRDAGQNQQVRDGGFDPNRDGGPPGRDAGVVPGRDGGQQAGRDGGQAGRDGGQANCTYPAGAVEPMALNEVMTPYSWATAIAVESEATFSFGLEDFFCNTTPGLDWSAYDALLFVTLPEW